MAIKTVLIIDDEEFFAQLVKMNLETSQKYKVLIASNGKDGIKLAKDGKPDVILLDITMPGMDGFEVLKVLKENAKTTPIPVIMLSALSEDRTKMKAAEMYSTYYITKPISADDLMAKIEWVLSLIPKKK